MVPYKYMPQADGIQSTKAVVTSFQLNVKRTLYLQATTAELNYTLNGQNLHTNQHSKYCVFIWSQLFF